MKKIVCLFYLILPSILLLCKPSFGIEWVKVDRVIDGDTIVLSDGRHIRYIGINALEIDHDNKKAEPFGYKGKNFNKKLVFEKKVRLEFDKEEHDQYGRVLAYVFTEDSIFVNKRMVEQGYAYCLYRKPNVKYGKVLLKFQRDAMSAKRGIWSNWKEKEDLYLGNRRSKRFHSKECPFGKRIGKINRKVFTSKWDAFWAGFAPSKRCVELGS